MTEALVRLMSTFFFQVPLRTFGLGMEVMSHAFAGMRQITEQGAEELEKAAAYGLGEAPRIGGGLEPTTVSGQGAASDEADVRKVFERSENLVDSSFVDDSHQTVATQPVVNPTIVRQTIGKEEEKMSCCDQDLSGCELKIVQYTIVNADPYIDDCDRVLTETPLIIATSDDLTDSDFTAWVIAKYIQDHPHRVPHCEKQYLRVCYCVMCRLTMPCTDYEKEQVDALRAINRSLHELRDKSDDDDSSGVPAKKTGK